MLWQVGKYVCLQVLLLVHALAVDASLPRALARARHPRPVEAVKLE
jgi:hypothetical protein